MATKVNVLFLQSQSDFTSTLRVHTSLMRYYNRERVEVYVACVGTERNKPPSLKVLETIPDLHLRLTNFGPTLFQQTKMAIAREAISSGFPAFIDMLGLAWYIKRHRINIIHASTTPREALYGILLAKLTGTKCVIHLHSKCNDWLGSRVLWAMKKADGIIAISDFVAQSLIAREYSPTKIYRVLNSVEASKWDYTLDGDNIRREFAIPANAPVLAIVGWLVPWKGHELLLKALAVVKEKFTGIKLLIVGEDDPDFNASQGGHSYKDYLQSLTHELNLDDHVIFTGRRSDVQQILAACDLYTMPAFEEGCGLAVLEAMAMRKAVIALDSGGVPELVEHGKAGFLSMPGDIQQFAEHILTLLNNPALRLRMGAYGRTRAEEYFNPQHMADDVEQIYRTVLGEHRESTSQPISNAETILH